MSRSLTPSEQVVADQDEDREEHGGAQHGGRPPSLRLSDQEEGEHRGRIPTTRGGDLARHVCDNCGSVVGEDQQFCPECGAWIDPTEPGIDEENGDFEEFSLSGEPPVDEPQAPARFPRSEVQCPSCGSPNPTTNRHCEECGARLSQGPLPVAPRPSVQATAGVRAVLAIAGLLTVVVIIAPCYRIYENLVLLNRMLM